MEERKEGAICFLTRASPMTLTSSLPRGCGAGSVVGGSREGIVVVCHATSQQKMIIDEERRTWRDYEKQVMSVCVTGTKSLL